MPGLAAAERGEANEARRDHGSPALPDFHLQLVRCSLSAGQRMSIKLVAFPGGFSFLEVRLDQQRSTKVQLSR